MSVARPAKRIRLTRKQNIQGFSLAGVLEDENGDAVRQVYLVTLAHPQGPTSREGLPLKAPSEYDRAGARDAILKCCAEPEYDPRWLSRHPGFVAQPVPVDKLVVFREYHAESADGVTHLHYHIALCLGQGARFMPFKRALLYKFGLASHWSCSHDGYWSAVLYETRATPHKMLAALDPNPLLWAADGNHPSLEVACIEATTAHTMPGATGGSEAFAVSRT